MGAIKISYVKTKEEMLEQLEKRKHYHNLQSILKEFSLTNNEILTFSWKESGYSTINAAVKCFAMAVQRGGWPMKVHQNGDTVWVEKIKPIKED